MEKNIIILFGGTSNERLVSVASAQFLSQALNKYRLWFWDLNNSVYEISQAELLSHTNPYTQTFKPKGKPNFSSITKAIKSPECENSIFVLVTHGGDGENGQLQKWLEESGRPYTGSCSKACEIAFDKLKTKQIVQAQGFRVAPHIVFNNLNKSSIYKDINKFFIDHGPSIAKPISGGSSLGVKFVRHEKDIKEAIDTICESTESYFLEKVIIGREITVGVTDTVEGSIALPCTEIILEDRHNFFYEEKYLGIGAKEITPANLSEGQTRDCQRQAIAAHLALNLYGYSRIDMIIDKKGPVFLEANTLPGLSRNSLIPQQLCEAEISMKQFLQNQISLATNR